MSAFYSFLRGFLYVPVKLVFPVKVIGRENIPLPSKVITVSNHLSGVDIALVAINVKGLLSSWIGPELFPWTVARLIFLR